MSSRNMCLLPRATLHSDSEQYSTCLTYLHGMTDVLVASFGSAQVAAVRVGCRAGTEVQAIVSGLFTSSFALGNFCGPTISGIEG